MFARLLPDIPFPPYNFVPGRAPHPQSDPAGYSSSVEPVLPAAVDPERWEECRTYLYGVDLFNAAYFWEAHVQWESLWLASGRKGAVADFLKGLIKLTAAGVKNLEGKPAGVKSHSRRAAQLWGSLGQDTLLGLQVGWLIELAETISRDGWPGEPPVLRPRRQP